MFTKNALIICVCVAGIFSQAILPSLIAVLAILAFFANPSVFMVSLDKGGGIKFRLEWLLPLILIPISIVASGGSSVSISYLLNFISMYFLIVFATSTLTIMAIAKILFIVMVISLVGAMIQFVFFFGADGNNFSQLSFVFSDRNELGMYLAAGCIANWYLLSNSHSRGVIKFIQILILIVLPVFMFALGSRSALLGLLLAFFTYFYFIKHTRRLLIAAVIVLVVAIFGFTMLPSDYAGNLRLLNPEASTGNSDIIRLSLIVISWQMFLQNPVLGVGPNQFLVESANYLPDVLATFSSNLTLSGGLVTHNSYLQYFVELGVVVGVYVIFRLLKIARLYFITRSKLMFTYEKYDLAFLFASATVFLTSGFFLNLHSSIFFIFVILGLDRLVKKTVRQSQCIAVYRSTISAY